MPTASQLCSSYAGVLASSTGTPRSRLTCSTSSTRTPRASATSRAVPGPGLGVGVSSEAQTLPRQRQTAGGGTMGAQQRDIWAMVEWLGVSANAEPCAGFAADPALAAAPGVYAFHADENAREVLGLVFGDRLGPVYVDQAGASARRTFVASGATLGSAIARTPLRGSTMGSSFRRSL